MTEKLHLVDPDTCLGVVGDLGLLGIDPPDRGLVQRRVIEVELGGETVWREVDVVRAFETAQEARNFASQHGIRDVDFRGSISGRN